MANHVYFNIDIDSTDEGLNSFEKTLVTTKRTQTNWEGTEIQVEELADIHDLAFMPPVKGVDDHGYPIDSYQWYVDNVGAKWCTIEEWEPMHISGYSAWSAPVGLIENMASYIGKADPSVSITMTYEDEFRNFVGVVVANKDGVQTVDELDGDELMALMKEHFDMSVDEELSDDFDWFGELEDVHGVMREPQEVMDDLVYDFFGQQQR
tara:strand:+ start:1128 stop:1751 length:624 start_codon:yes stop_codon:yes gene_type:complete